MFRSWIISVVISAFLIGGGWYVFYISNSQDQSDDPGRVIVSNREDAPRSLRKVRAEKSAPTTPPSKPALRAEPTLRQSVSLLLQAKKYVEARSILVEQIKSSPKDESSIEELAFLLADKLGEKDEARLLFQRLLELNPENSLALGLYKDLSIGQLAKEQATEFLMTQADRCYTCFDLLLVATDLLIDIHRTAEARDYLDGLNDSSLTESQARHLSSLYGRLGQNELARIWLQRAVEMAGNAEPRSSRSDVSSAWRNLDRAKLSQLANNSGQGI